MNKPFSKTARRTAALAAGCAMACSLLSAGLIQTSAKETSPRVEAILAGMSTRDKITQMIMLDFRQWDTDGTGVQDLTEMNDQVAKIIEDYNFGAVILLANNIKDTEQSFNLTREIQRAATRDGGLPVLITTDQEGGSVARLGSGTSLPGNMALGASGSLEDAKTAGEIIGSELSVLGINTSLAPVVDVNNNPSNPVIGLRSFGDDAESVGQLASAVIQGMSEYNVIGCAKHFPGHGDTATDSHYGLPIVSKSKEELLNNELKPYTVAISEGIDMIMTAHILYPGLDDSKKVSEKTGQEESLPATLNKAIITDLLKGEMGFDGVVSTDAMNMAGIAAAWSQPQAMTTAMEAGADLICMPTVLRNTASLADLDACIDYALAEHENGNLSDERLDDACRRILTLKEEKGILDYSEDNYSVEDALRIVGGEQNRAAERDISAHAVTVVKNENEVLPMDVQKNTNVLVCTPYDNEPGLCIMGWNRGKEAGIVPDGAKLDYAVYTNMSTPDDALKAKIDWADYVIAVTEVSGAAKMNGQHWASAMPDQIMNYGKDRGKKTIIMSAAVPYDVQSYPNADAIMAVYGNKGTDSDPTEALIGGITGTTATYGPNIIAGMEVALGTYGARGALPVNITKLAADGSSFTNEIVYERGYGLSYQSKADTSRKDMYRLYNPNSGEHFYTEDADEKDSLVNLGWNYEGIGWTAPAASRTPVYRLYNKNAGDHHFTISKEERDHLISVGWYGEGIAWYSDDDKSVPLYREYNPNAQAGSHNYTADAEEHAHRTSVGWRDEGIAWYGLN